MRRPGLLIAGVLLASGVSLALAAPASAAGRTDAHHPRHSHSHCNHHHGHHYGYDDDYYGHGGYGDNNYHGGIIGIGIGL
jgi:hypothetical protein